MRAVNAALACTLLGPVLPGWRARGESLAFAASSTRGGENEPLAAFRKGIELYRAERYRAAAESLAEAGATAGPRTAGLRNLGWVRWLEAEALFYDGAFARARKVFEQLEKQRDAPRAFADGARWREADCLWMEGSHREAAARYAKLKTAPPVNGTRDPEGPAVGDLALARFRQAVAADEGGKQDEALRLFGEVYRTYPAHPLAARAATHLPVVPAEPAETANPAPGQAQGGAPGQTTNPTPTQTKADARAAEDHLKRAETLTKDRLWDQALAELAAIGPETSEDLRVERDYQIGMTKFHMRRDYAKAGELLIATSPKLSGEKAASALFHGTRALSRADRDDEAIAGYAQVVARFPSSRYAAEAQYLAGWLDYNRGRFRESLPALEATIAKFGHSAFADDAAWCVAFAQFQLGAWDEAGKALARYERLETKEMSAGEKHGRVAYWRARVAEKAGKKDEGRAGLKEVSQRWPLSFYALAAEARLREAGADVPPPFGGARATTADETGNKKTDKNKDRLTEKLARDPDLARADELAKVGLDVEAGWWLGHQEGALLKRLGSDGVPLLLRRYAETSNYRRALRLAEAKDAGRLDRAPDGDGRRYWEAAFPKAYAELVEKLAADSGNPGLYLYAIMRKESAFDPWDVSYADARGLLQMIPPTSSRVAEEMHETFFPEALYEPETNIRLGAHYIGSLVKKFAGQIPLAAGAYNAGPKAMRRWVEQHGRHPMDEMVELVAFAQTREYIKRVVGLYAHYRYLYGPTPYALPLTVKTEVSASGPEY